MNKNPLVSVLMPAYNAEKYIGEAIESILNQTFKDFEFIIVNDGSKDNTLKIIEKYKNRDSRIILINNSVNLKISKSLNTGINLSKGKYIARMDADDYSYPHRLERQFKFMENNPSIGVLGGAMEIINENGKSIGKRTYASKDKEIRRKMFRYSPFSHPLIMIRKSVLDLAGLYNSRYDSAEDYELYFRLGVYTKFANLSDVLLRYRERSKSITLGSTKKMELKTIKIRNENLKNKEYKVTTLDNVYNYLHLFSIYTLPSSLRIKIFNFIRNSK
jgi:glycosyltransferase involved in cell wall biosynthesis